MANGDNNGITLAQIRSGTKYFQSDATTVNADLKAVQKALYLYGFCPGGSPDGKFGSGTLGAVNGFQKEHNMTVNGRIDKATLAKIEAWSGTLYAAPTTTPSLTTVKKGLDFYSIGDTGNNVTTIRTLLNARGYSCATTGDYDVVLASVVKTFQTAMGLSSDGSVGQATLAALEDGTSDTSWISGTTVKLTAGKLARCGFKNILLRDDIVTQLNSALNTHKINTKEKVKHFLAQAMAETDYGLSLVEYSYRPGTMGTDDYAPYYGGGVIQLTWKDAYEKYKNYNGDSAILSPDVYATQHVAFKYPADSAGWYWNTYKSFNNGTTINWNDTAQNICTQLTTKIKGSSSGASARYTNYQNISKILK